jgi:hypothetical protein
MRLTERHAALRATRGLLGCLLRNEIRIDLMEIARASLRRAFFGHNLPKRHEFLHAFGHERPPNGATMGDRSTFLRFFASARELTDQRS